jgi:chemotaxis protein MotB
MRDKEVDRLSKLSEQMAITLEQQIKADQVQIKSNGEWLEVDIQASVLFPSGSASLQSQAVEILARLASVLKDAPNPIHVEGYTDNVPIETDQFPSNWELSAARAASVVRLFQEQKLDPARLAAVGYAEFHPVADNKTEEGRARNRRISLVISKNESDGKIDAPAAPDYKLGATDPRQSGEGKRMRAADGAEVPVRVIRLEDGGVLFSGDKPGQPAP